MVEKDFDKLEYDKIIIENDNLAKVVLGKYLLIVHEVENVSEVIYSIFKNREYILTDYKSLDSLIDNMNSFIREHKV